MVLARKIRSNNKSHCKHLPNVVKYACYGKSEKKKEKQKKRGYQK